MIKDIVNIKSRVISAVQRRARRLVRTKIRPIINRRPTVIHLVYQGPKGNNRGDAVMSLVIPQILKSLCPNLNIVSVQLSELRANIHLERVLGPCDLVIIGGGGLYGKWFFLDNLLCLQDLGVPIVLYALGLNINYGDQDLPDEMVETIYKLNKIATLSSVRDKMTQDFLKKLGINAHLIGDPGCFFNPGKTLGIRHRKSEFNVGLNLPYHGFTSQDEIIDRAIPIISKVAEELCQAGASLHYMLHDPQEHRIIERLKGLPLQVCEGGVRKLVRQYFKLDLLIGGMLHSNIFAFNAGVPFICLAYDKKHEAFLELINYRDSYMGLNDLSLNVLRTKIAEVRADLSNHREAINQTRKSLWKEHEAFARNIVGLIFQNKN